MKTILSFILFFTFLSVEAIRLIPDSKFILIDSTSLTGKSREFLHYARNEIYARHGYVFSDKDLDLYFKKQNWYMPTDKAIELTEVEKRNIAILKRFENSFEHPEYALIKKFNLEGRAVFYIGRYWAEKNNGNWKTKQNDIFIQGSFYGLNSQHSWTLDCETIPPEAIIKLADTTIEASDAYQVFPEDMNLMSDNQKCSALFGNKIEVFVHGPSSDLTFIILGIFDDKLHTFFKTVDYVKEYYCINDSILKINLNIPKNIAGTCYLDQTYYLNIKTAEIQTPNSENLEIQASSTTLKKLKFYSTKEGASTKDSTDLKGYLNENTVLTFKTYYRGMQPGAIYFENDINNGWINYSLINQEYFKLNFSSAD